MTDDNRPDWVKNAKRSDRPAIERHYRPEEGPLDGVLFWQGDITDARSREQYRLFIIQEEGTGLNVAVSERAALRPLRDAKIGSRVFIEPEGKAELGDGRQMWKFALFVQAPMATPRGGTPKPPVTPPSSDDVPF